MKITILAVGSCGDVQPAIALGVGLRRAGYTVCIGSYAQFALIGNRRISRAAPAAAAD